MAGEKSPRTDTSTDVDTDEKSQGVMLLSLENLSLV